MQITAATKIAQSLNRISSTHGDAAAFYALGELLASKLDRAVAAGDIDPATVTKEELFNFTFECLDGLRD